MGSRRKTIPADSLLQLRQRLDRLPPKSPERAAQIAAMAQLYGISATTVYRSLRYVLKPRTAHRGDHGRPRILPLSELEHYCELIAALKLRTTNKSGRHLSTGRAIQLLEEHGVETAQGLVKSPVGLLRKQTVNRWLSLYRLDQPRLLREPPAIRFQAECSNDCWQFDMSPSDLKHIERPDWVDPQRGAPMDADIAAVEAQLNTLLPDEEKNAPERPARKPLPAHLPRVTKTIEPALTESCPDCQGALRHIRDEVSEKLEYIPDRVVVNRYVRPQYGCTCCQRVVSGHMPLHRQQPVLARSDIHLPVSTMADMVGRAGAALTPLAESLHRMLLTRDVLHADETPLQILDTKKGGKARAGYLWAYVSGEKSGPAVVCFDSQPGRSSRYTTEYLKNWTGRLVVDGYPAYETLAGQNKGVVLTGCWAHARRNFADLYKASKDPRAEMAVRQIAGLYRLEKKIRDRPVEKIRQ
ncbi:hypothetical protein SME06J_49260 (plasmid) [Serratia marcescens]|nr:hypothetical protein SME06J_49260 [Serratia marcescens]